MTRLKLPFLQMTILLLSGVAGHGTGNFPLNDCQTGLFDILILHITGKTNSFFHTSLPEKVANVWLQDNRRQSRVLVSMVTDSTAASDNQCNITLSRFDKVVTDLCTSFPHNNSSSSKLYLNIKLKIQMASAIFSDSEVGRQNSTRVAVIIHDSSNFPTLTAGEVNKIPDILQEESSDIKTFVIIHGFENEVEPVFIRDTIIAGSYINIQQINIALCKQCLPGWFLLEYKETGDFISCYKLHVSPTKIDWFQALTTCTEEGFNLATVENKEELHFLQEQLFVHLLANIGHIYDSRDSYQESVEVYIGLKRDSKSVAKRFQWTLENPIRYRPLVINHWLPCEPFGGFNHACGVWTYSGIFSHIKPHKQIFGDDKVNNSLLSENMSNTFDGWSSVGCGTPVTSMSLCEVTLYRHDKENDVIRLDPANKQSYYRAFNSGDFKEFSGNIVSVAAYLQDETFLDFMKIKRNELPMFDCGEDATDPRYIALYHVYDNVNHCRNGRDELIQYKTLCELCDLETLLVLFCSDSRICGIQCNIETECEECGGKRCCDGTCLPLHLFNDGEIDCINCRTTDGNFVNDETISHEEYTSSNETCAFLCNINACIHPSQLNDGNIDCIDLEGPLDETIGKLEKANSCSDIIGRAMWAPMCVYLTDRYGSVLGCRDLSHLQNCSDFSCQEAYYKCPGSYCIPLHYVMDGKSDCPSGEEERHLVNYTCVGHFRCWNSSVYLHPDQVCDGAFDCPQKDDEMNCGFSCIDGLRCLAGTVTVDTNKPLVRLHDITFLSAHTYHLDLSGVDLSSMIPSMDKCLLLVELKLSGCKIVDTNFSNFPFHDCCMFRVYTLDLSFNLIRIIDYDALQSRFWYWLGLRELNLSYNEQLEVFVGVVLFYLETLDLSHTGLTHVEENSFGLLDNLAHLNLSYTRLTTFHRYMFPALYTLHTLDLRGSPILHFVPNTNNDLIITSSLYTDNFALCCPQVRGTSIPEYTCHASEDTISSCFNLIGDDIAQILLWLMAGIAISGNLIVIFYRLIWDRHLLEKAYGLFVLNLGISDLLMGLYLLMIDVANIYYRGVYALYDREWRESVFCKLAGFLSVLSSKTSTFFMFLITVDRYLTLKYPYGQKKFSRINKIVVIYLSWTIGVMLALIPVLPIFGNNSILTSTPMCNGVLVANHRLNGSGYSLAVFIVVNCVMFVFTALGQILIFKSMTENRMSVESTNQYSLRRAQDILVAKQLSLIVLFNFLSLFPVGLIGFLSLSGHVISSDFYVWVVVLVLPVNAAINPVIYTIPVLMEQWKKFRIKNSRPH